MLRGLYGWRLKDNEKRQMMRVRVWKLAEAV